MLHELLLYLIYFVGGLAFIGSICLMITRFFGYRVKTTRKQVIMNLIVAAVYAAICMFTSYIRNRMSVTGNASEYTISPENVMPVLGLFYLIYWMVRLSIRKGKAFLITVSAMQVYFVFRLLIASIADCIINLDIGNKWLTVVMNLMVPVLPLLIIYLFSKLAQVRCREEMNTSLITLNLIVFVIFNEVFSFFFLPDAVEVKMPISIYFQSDWENNRSIFNLAIDVVICFLITLAMFLIVKASESVYFRKKSDTNEYYLETQKQYYEKLIQSNQEIRKIKHDMKNHIYCISELNRTGNYGELTDYLNRLREDVDHTDSGIHVGNLIADAILSEKKAVAEKAGVIMTVEGEMNDTRISAMDTCTMIANALDNALEAVKAGDRIAVSFRKNENFFFLSVTNPVVHPVEIKDNQVKTTKKNSAIHGFGLANIRDAVSRYEGECLLSNQKDEKDEYLFQVEIIIPLA